MTPLIKNLLSLLAASGTAVGGGLLYTNRETIFRSLGWGGEEASNDVNSEGSLDSEMASGGQRENTTVVSGSDTLTPSGSTNSAVNPPSLEAPAPVSVPSGSNPSQGSETTTQRTSGQDGASISASGNQDSNPGRAEGVSQTNTVQPLVQENANDSASDTPEVQGGASGGQENRGQRVENPNSGTPSTNPPNTSNTNLASGTPSESNQEGVSTPALQAATAKDYQCAFENKEYGSEPNKKALKDFLAANGGEGQGLQILGPGNGEFNCAKDVEDSTLSGLSQYLRDLGDSFSSPQNRPGQEPNVWAVKKDENGWTIYGEDDDSDEEILAAIKPTTVE